MKGPKRLVVNADDFGFARDVNRGIIAAHTRGILTATTLMANGAAFDDAVQLARQHPSLDVGCHLVLVQGPSLFQSGLLLPATVRQLIQAVLLRQFQPFEELRAQVERILSTGLRPLHLDTHKHTHLFPPILDAVARLSDMFRIPWVRRPFDFPMEARGVPWPKRVVSRSLQAVRHQFHRKLQRHGCRTTDHFAGFQITGRYRKAELLRLLNNLPPGTTEFMTHPGFCTDELRRTPTRLTESREEELRALTAPEVKAALAENGVELLRYRDL